MESGGGKKFVEKWITISFYSQQKSLFCDLDFKIKWGPNPLSATWSDCSNTTDCSFITTAGKYK